MNFLGKKLGKNNHPCIVAEISCNHEGSLEQARELIYQAKVSGADAVKIQTYVAEDMTLNLDTDDFIVKEGPWRGQCLSDLYTRAGLPSYDWLPELFSYARGINIPLFSSVFSLKGLEALEALNCPAYKIASFELTDTYLIKKVAKTSKPIVLSTGMADLNDIDRAMECVDPSNSVLLHCTSGYPTKFEHANLWKIQHYAGLFPCPIGFSDHTKSMMAGQLACAAGARMIEKHMSLGESRSEDAEFSFSPTQFALFVKACRRASEASWRVDIPEEQSSRQFRRSVYAVADIKQGEALTLNNIRAIRPGYGLPANMYSKLLYMRAKTDIKKGTALKMEYVE